MTDNLWEIVEFSDLIYNLKNSIDRHVVLGLVLNIVDLPDQDN